ncbi:hypothetical protein V2J09_000857 [Rumex salicifolius]
MKSVLFSPSQPPPSFSDSTGFLSQPVTLAS